MFKLGWVRFASVVFAALLLTSCPRPIPPKPPAGQQLELQQGITLRHPRNWELAPRTYRNMLELHARVAEADMVPPKDTLESLGRIMVTIEERRNHKEALGRLRDIAAERVEAANFVAIGDWPALERTFRAPLPNVGEQGPVPLTIVPWVTTAVAVDHFLVRLETTLATGAPEALAAQAVEIGRSLRAAAKGDPKTTQSEVETLRKEGPSVSSPVPPPPVLPAVDETLKRSADDTKKRPGEALPGAATSVQGGVGELEVAVADNGQNVVVAANSGFSFSNDGGQTWTFGGGTPGAFPRDGDPSLGVGASNNFYYAFIGFPDGTLAAGGVLGCSTGVAQSTNNGATFGFVNHAVVCPQTGAGICFPDQEHIAVDRDNAAPGGGDQLYSVWRNFTPAGVWSSCNAAGSGFVTPSIVCSQDSAANWTGAVAIGTGDFPRAFTASDGNVYVVYNSGNNVMLNKYSSCAAGLTQQAGFPVTVAAGVTAVTCPVAGLDRCNNGNDLRSMTVTVDDTNANHVFVAYATTSVAGNENVVLRDSTDGGLTFPNTATLNGATAARRFMPWSCSVAGSGLVSWYDRSAAAGGTNDLTDFYVGGVSTQTSGLVAHRARNLSVNADPQCASGWPCAPRSTNDSESCSVQPQTAGRCIAATGPSSFTPCDFSTPACAAGETCQTGSGCPKYGDYNGVACVSNRIYTAWASATAPPGLPAAAGLRVYSSVVAVSDFYVRDWTDSAASGDDGAEPSTHANFYSTSDVWNRRGTDAGTFINDQPPNEPAGNGADGIGDNWAFARIRRNASPPTGDALVSAHFLVSKLGTGSNYVDASSVDPDVTLTGPDPSILFNAADLGPTITVAYPWHLNAISSTHLCLAVEISSVGDPFIGPSLLGFAPGGLTDQKIRNDNNAAQRNMGLSTTPARGSSGAAGFWAIAHNASNFSRDMILGISVSPEHMKRLEGALVEVVGEGTRPLAPKDQIVLKGLQPGENRWVGLRFKPPAGKPGEIVTVDFQELVNGSPVNGFMLGALLADDARLARDAVELYRSTFARLAAAFRIDGAEKIAKAAQALLEKKEISSRDYLTFIQDQREPTLATLSVYVSKLDQDALDVRASLKQLREKPPRTLADAAVVYGELFNKIDTATTMRQLAVGDIADISQTVRWQAALAQRHTETVGSECGLRLWRSSYDFARDYSLRRVGPREYAKHVAKELACLPTVAKELQVNAESELQTLRDAVQRGDATRTQGAQRALLLKLAPAVRR